jgi:hypothetical protein
MTAECIDHADGEGPTGFQVASVEDRRDSKKDEHGGPDNAVRGAEICQLRLRGGARVARL